MSRIMLCYLIILRKQCQAAHIIVVCTSLRNLTCKHEREEEFGTSGGSLYLELYASDDV